MTGGGFFNGQAVQEAWTLARGLHYGDGVFRTCLAKKAILIDGVYHRRKLATDALALGLSPTCADLAMTEACAIAERCGEGVIKILLWRSGASRGYSATTQDSERLVLHYPLPSYEVANWRIGVRVARSPIALAEQPRLAGVKHLNRLDQVLASKDWPKGIDEILMTDAAGRPICGTRSNLFWIHEGRLYTPELVRCGVAGVMRERILECATGLRWPLEIGPWSWSALLAADEVFVSNSLIGIWPVRELELRSWHVPGARTAELSAALAHPALC